MTQYDTVVVGGGPAGYAAAIRCAQLGAKTAIIERHHWGGNSFHHGGVVMATLLRHADVARLLTRDKETFGIRGDVTCDFSVAVSRAHEVSGRMVKGAHFLLRKYKVTEYQGEATCLDAHTLKVEFANAAAESLTCDNLIIATGGLPRTLPATAINDRIMTYQQMMRETTVPRSIIICGGGPTGLEFAYVMASFGAAVTLIEAESRLLPSADPELSSELTKSLRAACVTIMTGHRVDRVLPSGEGAEVEVSPPMGGLARRLTADKVLIAFGQTPATTGFGLEKVGVEMTDGQGIAVDDRGRTSVPGVYAIGDVTGGLMQADLAQSQGVVAAETIAGVQTFPPDPAMTPHHVGCAPQAAWFGLTESQARAAGHDPVVSKYPLAVNGQACAMGITDGFVKIVADRAHHEVLGAHVVGPGAAELLPQLTMAQLWDLTADEVATVIPIHPTLSEAVSQAALGVSGHMITF